MSSKLALQHAHGLPLSRSIPLRLRAGNCGLTLWLVLQIMACKDTLAQQYLLDCVVQVFSDECHLQTLDLLLAETANVQRGGILRLLWGRSAHARVLYRQVYAELFYPSTALPFFGLFFAVALKPVLVNLLNRLTSFLQADPEVRVCLLDYWYPDFYRGYC